MCHAKDAVCCHSFGNTLQLHSLPLTMHVSSVLMHNLSLLAAAMLFDLMLLHSPSAAYCLLPSRKRSINTNVCQHLIS